MKYSLSIKWIVVFLFLNTINSFAQDTTKTNKYIFVRNIIIEGNKKTKPFVIKNELYFKENDAIIAEKLFEVIAKNKVNVFNLKLFNDVKINIKNWENDSLDIIIEVRERFKFIPLPFVKFADRNANEWWRLYNHDFKRLQYGFIVNWGNVSGRNDYIIFRNSFGFAQMLDITYGLPQINKKGKIGMNFNVAMMRSKRVNYNTIDDKLKFLDLNTKFQLNTVSFNSQITYRPTLYKKHKFVASYAYTKIEDSVSIANPNYLLGFKKQHALKIGYEYTADHRNFTAYPTAGWLLKFGAVNYGLGLLKSAKFSYTYFQMSEYNLIKNKHSTAHFGKFLLSFPYKQPYNLQPEKSLGYNQDFVRGYEYNVINGQNYLLFKNEYRFKALDFKLKSIKMLQNTSLAYVPINVYVKAYFDAAYMFDRFYTLNNTLANTWMYGYGLGIDIVTFNDKMFRIEYSFNKQFKNGLFLHFDLPL